MTTTFIRNIGVAQLVEKHLYMQNIYILARVYMRRASDLAQWFFEPSLVSSPWIISEMESKWRWPRLVTGIIAAFEIKRARRLLEFDSVSAESLETALKHLAIPPGSASDTIERAASVCVYLYSLSVYFQGTLFVGAGKAISSASRLVRDLVTWRTLELGGLVSSKTYVKILEAACGRAFADVRGDLRSQMTQSWFKVNAKVFPSAPEALPRRKRNGKKPTETTLRSSSRSGVTPALRMFSEGARPVSATRWDEPWRC